MNNFQLRKKWTCKRAQCFSLVFNVFQKLWFMLLAALFLWKLIQWQTLQMNTSITTFPSVLTAALTFFYVNCNCLFFSCYYTVIARKVINQLTVMLSLRGIEKRCPEMALSRSCFGCVVPGGASVQVGLSWTRLDFPFVWFTWNASPVHVFIIWSNLSAFSKYADV